MKLWSPDIIKLVQSVVQWNHVSFKIIIIIIIIKIINSLLINNNFMLWSIDPEYSSLPPTARQPTALVWLLSDATSSRGVLGGVWQTIKIG